MKKSLIALAVLAASGAAMAQSSVTLYGRLDASLVSLKTETTANTPANAKASVTQTRIDSSTLNTVFWGMKGTEDLGNGLKANFKLESNFNIDTGAAGQTLFEREASVGLSGGFGAVNLGRQYTSYYSFYSATNNILDTNVSMTTSVWNGTGVANTTVRASNAIRFNSADYSGFSGSVSYGINEFVAPQNENGSNIAFNLKYAAGPILVGVAYEEVKLAYQSPAAQPSATKNTLVAGSYDFGVVKLTGGYNKASNGSRDDKEYQLGLNIPVSAAATVLLGYANSNSTGAGLVELNGKGYTIAGVYSLSKRTTLYAGMFSRDVDSGATVAALTTAKATAAAVGVRHLF